MITYKPDNRPGNNSDHTEGEFDGSGPTAPSVQPGASGPAPSQMSAELGATRSSGQNLGMPSIVTLPSVNSCKKVDFGEVETKANEIANVILHKRGYNAMRMACKSRNHKHNGFY
jgi:hypothetical protein